MHTLFMANAPTVTLDPTIAALCDAADEWLDFARMSALCLGVTLPAGLAALLPRLHTGYMPEQQRRANDHRALSNGLRTRPPTNPNAKIKADARRLGFAC